MGSKGRLSWVKRQQQKRERQGTRCLGNPTMATIPKRFITSSIFGCFGETGTTCFIFWFSSMDSWLIDHESNIQSISFSSLHYSKPTSFSGIWAKCLMLYKVIERIDARSHFQQKSWAAESSQQSGRLSGEVLQQQQIHYHMAITVALRLLGKAAGKAQYIWYLLAFHVTLLNLSMACKVTIDIGGNARLKNVKRLKPLNKTEVQHDVRAMLGVTYFPRLSESAF